MKNKIENESLWQDIRSNWVNGNLSLAKDRLYQLNKRAMLLIILEAINTYNESCSPHTHSGDLQDLKEIIHSLTKNSLY